MTIDLENIKNLYPVASHLYGQFLMKNGLGGTMYQFFDENDIYPWTMPDFVRNSDKIQFRYGAGKVWWATSDTRDVAEVKLFQRCFSMLEKKLSGRATPEDNKTMK